MAFKITKALFRNSYFGNIFYDHSIFQKIFDGEMLITNQPTTLLHIFFMNNLKVIFASITVPDDTCLEGDLVFEHEWVNLFA